MMTGNPDSEFVMLPVIQSRGTVDDSLIKGSQMTYFLQDNRDRSRDGISDDLPLVIFENVSGINLPPGYHYWCGSPVCFHGIIFDYRYYYTHSGRGRGTYVVMTGDNTF
jgi:hypothetical protein